MYVCMYVCMYGQPLPTVKLISSENVVDFLVETEDAILFYKIYIKKNCTASVFPSQSTVIA